MIKYEYLKRIPPFHLPLLLYPSKCGTMGHLLAVAPLTSVFRNDTTCSRHPPVTDSQGEEQQWRAGSSDTVSEDVLILIL